MREIKFRAWDSLNNQMWQAGQDGESIGDWTFQTYFDPSTHCFKALIYGNEFLVTDDPYPMYDHEERFLPIMQYTGLRDKNGTDIYEGDILRDEQGIGEVKWLQEHFSFVVRTISPTHRYISFMSNGSLTNTKIIGNIYRNKELLTKEV